MFSRDRLTRELMPMSATPEHLLADFPPASYEEWRKAAEKLIKGAPFDKKLVTTTAEGIATQPIYRREDVAELPHADSLPGQAPYLRGRLAAGYLEQGWRVSQELPCATPTAFNTAARAAVEAGQTELNASELSLASAADVAAALKDLPLEKVSLNFQAGANALPLVRLLAAHAKERGLAPEALRGCVASDPLAMLARDGALPSALEETYGQMKALLEFGQRETPSLELIGVNTAPYHDGGCNAVEELAFALATGAEYLRALISRGLSVDAVAPRIRFSFSVGSDFFMELAKLRAARLAWAQVVAAFGGSPEAQAMRIHARTARWNKTLIDPHTNILRATTEAFSAVLGGCDSLHVGAFDEVAGGNDPIASRLARNTQLVLAEECETRRVLDPAGGSYYIEWLTDTLATRAWMVFQELERQGGMAAALIAGIPQRLTETTARARLTAVGQRKSTVIGVNNYPNPKEVSLRPAPAKRAPSTGAVTCAPVPPRRWSEPYEALRAACEAYRAREGHAPTIFQANIGESRLYRARADWTSNFFRVGGLEVIADKDFATPEAAAEAARASGAKVAVITTTDETYATAVPALAPLLRQAGITVLVAGQAGDSEAAWREAGVADYVHVRANNHETLVRVLALLGVK